MLPVSCLPPLPGFGLSLDWKGDGILFASALDPELEERECESRMPILTLREIAILQLMDKITDKPEWDRKIFDEKIVQKWKAEITSTPGPEFTQGMFDYCIEELKYKAEIFKKTGYVQVYNGDVIKSDSVIPADLRDALKAAVAPLEDVPAHKRDWHPGSGNQVLDLVHPSLFPLVYGTSRILTDSTVGLYDCISRCGQGEVVPQPPGDVGFFDYGRQGQFRSYSRKFQWLPCEVDISGDEPKIASYINNLHPQEHPGLYTTIENVIEKIIPLWNATLSPLRGMEWPLRVPYDCIDYGDYDKYVKNEAPEPLENESDGDYEERVWEWKEDIKEGFVVQPTPQPFYREVMDRIRGKVDLKRDFGERGLQVIVKLANIHLTPDKPTYNGGTWHVEGQLGEHICATAIYYYDMENITSSRLAFRQASDVRHVEEDLGYDQNDYAWLRPVFGLRNEAPAIQEIGSVEAREGRLVTFPNVLQHRVEPFGLADPTKPGLRKILAFFLVDPHIKIISTANVPCQQRDWWRTTVTPALSKLPTELQDKVIEDVGDFPLSVEQAKQLREELIEERKEYVLGHQTMFFQEVTISLCEH